MPIYHTPGVYFEWLNTRPPELLLQRTDITGFVGITARGPLHTAIKIESWSQFTSHFGSYIPQAFLAYSIQAFFANGGQTCWVVRAADPATAANAWVDLLDEYNQPALRLTACSPGTWAHALDISVLRSGSERFTLTLRLPDGTQELWRDLTVATAADVLNNQTTGSGLVCAKRQNQVSATLQVGRYRPHGGQDGLATLRPAHLSGNGAPEGTIWGLATLESIAEIAILAMPDIANKDLKLYQQVPLPKPSCEDVTEPEGQDQAPGGPLAANGQPASAGEIEYPPPFDKTQIAELQWQMVLQCEQLKNRVAILDVPQPGLMPTAAIDWRKAFDTTYAALYYPWLRVPDPLGKPGDLRDIPASGHVAGVYGRVEKQFGAHKPPANELLAQAQDVTMPVDDVIHGLLNDNAVNALRAYPGRGLRVAGARIATSESDLQFVNVRRLLLMIERSIDVGTQWIVFEPNNPQMWADTERVIGSFLDQLWQRGMLDGDKAEDAYVVHCDATTNPPEETDQGRLICLIGVLPPWPAEFVIARIGKTESGTQVLEG